MALIRYGSEAQVIYRYGAEAQVTYRYGASAQEVEVCVLPKEVALWVGGLELLSAHDEVAGKVTSCVGRTEKSQLKRVRRKATLSVK